MLLMIKLIRRKILNFTLKQNWMFIKNFLMLNLEILHYFHTIIWERIMRKERKKHINLCLLAMASKFQINLTEV